MQVKPYNTDQKSKKEEVAEMFNNISDNYDFLNRVLSMRVDVGWRNKTVKKVKEINPSTILDIATGTADLAIALTETNAMQIIGVDISEGMLKVGREKVKKKNLDKLIELKLGDSESLPFADGSFDAVTVAFGVRNFEHPILGLQEIHRVLKKGGKLFVLEFSQPEKAPVKQIYNFYFKNILPRWGKIVSRDNRAYQYLHDSVQVFPYGKAFLDLMNKAGFKNATDKKLSFGIASLYIGEK